MALSRNRNSVKLDSFAKINLYLSVRSKRKDNYHGLTTIFERISLKDTISVHPRKDKQIKITSNNNGLACDASNFVWQAVELLRRKFNITQGLNIRINKRVPLGSGMGGGSSNAACVLAGLNKSWNLGLSVRQLAGLGAKIGSDVPFFVYDSPFAVGRGRGEKISPEKSLKNVKLWHVIVVPGINVSTALIYRKWDELKSLGLIPAKRNLNIKNNNCLSGLTMGKSGVKLIPLALKSNDLFLLNKAIYNSLEPVSESLFDEIRKVKEVFLAQGAQLIMMSGSGPAVFGIVSSKKEAVSLSRRIRKVNPFWKIFVASTC